MIKTSITEALGCRHPIILGGMAWTTRARLVAAVANAGAAALIAGGGQTAQWLQQEIIRTKALTDEPFGVNIPLDLSREGLEEIFQVIIDAKIPYVALAAGDPRPYLPGLHAAGIKVISVVPNLKLAKRMEEFGADILVIEGTEAGGHVGKLTTMAQMTNILPEIHIPVAAAGGIVDGRGLAAALVMGAGGVQMGSRFLLAEECEIFPASVQEIIKATDTDSVVTGSLHGSGMRGLKSAFSEKYLELERSCASKETLDNFASGSSRKVMEEGVGPDGMNGMIQVGQSLVPLKRVQPAAEIVEEIMRVAEAILRNAPQLVMD